MPVPVAAPGIQGLSADALLKLQHLQNQISERLADGELSAALVKEAGGLARSIIALGGELRQQEKFYSRSAEKLSDEEVDELIIEHVQEVSPSRRGRIRAAIEEADGDSTLLG